MSFIAPSENKIVQESVSFNQPVSESSLTAIGALANALREIILPLGSIVHSMLTEVQFQAQNTSPSPDRWILADGRSVVGSAYANLTGFTNVPDLRGIFLRSKNNGRVDGNQNPDGDLALGTYTADKFLSHTHTYQNAAYILTLVASPGNGGLSPFVDNTGATGGNETAPKDVTVNIFIRIN